eukprot:SAG25_NODE_5176_length_692_cov_1.482293_1_plen_66_part_10
MVAVWAAMWERQPLIAIPPVLPLPLAASYATTHHHAVTDVERAVVVAAVKHVAHRLLLLPWRSGFG